MSTGTKRHRQFVALAYPEAAVCGAGWAAIDAILDLDDCAGLDLHIPASGYASTTPTIRRLAAVVTTEHHKELRAHAWVGRRGKGGIAVGTWRDGFEQASHIALLASNLGAGNDGPTVVGFNAERDVYRGPRIVTKGGRRTQAPTAMEFLRGVHAGIKSHNQFAGDKGWGKIESRDLGYIDPARYYTGGHIDEDVLNGWDGWAAMAYTTPASRAVRLFHRGLLKRNRMSPHGGLYRGADIWLPVGRVDKLGRVVGDAEGWLSEAPRLAAQDYLGDITWYVGQGSDRWPARAAWRQLVEGHRRHPALVDMIPKMARALRGQG